MMARIGSSAGYVRVRYEKKRELVDMGSNWDEFINDLREALPKETQDKPSENIRVYTAGGCIPIQSHGELRPDMELQIRFGEEEMHLELSKGMYYIVYLIVLDTITS